MKTFIDGAINKIIVGADRITGHGDIANKIGTYSLAVLAQHHKIPFYVAAPSSTFDLSLNNGDQIPIEERQSEEITHGFGRQTAPKGVSVYNPAFDVTPAELIDSIITERGVIHPVTADKVAELKARMQEIDKDITSGARPVWRACTGSIVPCTNCSLVS